MFLHRLLLPLLLMLSAAAGIEAKPLTPASDADVVETLPLAGSQRSEVKRLRAALTREPRRIDIAVPLALRLLDQARRDGEPRFAGQALAVLRPWADDNAHAPADALLALADTEQHLHQFDHATRRLQALLARNPDQAQAWLMLATLQRVQGRYASSDDACRHLAALGALLHAQACLAENAALRGRFDDARLVLRKLLAADRTLATQAWLNTTLAELEAHAGRPAEAQAAFQAALAAKRDAYTAIALADLLIARHRPQDVPAVLAGLPRSDSVLLRLAIAARDARDPQAKALAGELRERMADAGQRYAGTSPHAREQALFALRIDGDAQRALQLARANARLQREPIDLLVLANAARAAGQDEATNEGRALAREIGFHDLL